MFVKNATLSMHCVAIGYLTLINEFLKTLIYIQTWYKTSKYTDTH